MRARFADELESIVAEARRGGRELHPCVPLQRAAIISAADELLALGAEVRSAGRYPAHVAALVSFLLRDACSPLYFDQARATPVNLARAARAGIADTWTGTEL